MIPDDMLSEVAAVDRLSRWERAELGRRLRRLGLTYTEIAALIPAARSTIAGWCREIDLSEDQKRAIEDRTGAQKGIPRDTQHARRNEVAAIANQAMSDAGALSRDPFWLGGVTLYWAEGFKTERTLGMANADSDLLRYFVAWTLRYHDPQATFRAKLNLHAGNDEGFARSFWARELDLDESDFSKTYIKADGTGHRKNHLHQGVCQIRMRRSGNAFHRTIAWIEHLRRRDHLQGLLSCRTGR